MKYIWIGLVVVAIVALLIFLGKWLLEEPEDKEDEEDNDMTLE